MPNDVITAPRLANDSHEHATDAPDRRGAPTSPISPSQQLPSLLEVDQLKQECHFTRTEVIEDELLPKPNVEFVRVVPWSMAEEADYPALLSCSSTSRWSATADFGTSRDANTVSVQSHQIQSTLGDNQSFTGESRGNDAMSIEDSPARHREIVDLTLDLEEALSSPKIVAVGPLDIAPDSFHFSNPSELSLPIPYPTTIAEDAPSLCYHRIHAEH